MADIIPPQRNEAWLNPDNTPTLRFAEFIESLTTTSNETVTVVTTVDDGVTNSAFALSASVQKELDSLIATMQAPLVAKVGQLEKELSDIVSLMQAPLIAKIGQLEKLISDLETAMIVPISDDRELNEFINTQQTSPIAAWGELEKRVNFLEGNI